MTEIRVYLAGPEVFLSDMAEVQEAKKYLTREHGLIPVAPATRMCRINQPPNKRHGDFRA